MLVHREEFKAAKSILYASSRPLYFDLGWGERRVVLGGRDEKEKGGREGRRELELTSSIFVRCLAFA